MHHKVSHSPHFCFAQSLKHYFREFEKVVEIVHVIPRFGWPHMHKVPIACRQPILVIIHNTVFTLHNLMNEPKLRLAD